VATSRTDEVVGGAGNSSRRGPGTRIRGTRWLWPGLVLVLFCLPLCRLAGPLCGMAAVLVLFAHQPLLFEHGLRGNNMESSVVLVYCAGVYHFLGWSTSGGLATRRWHVFALGLYFVLGFMTKFVAALFLPLVLAVMVLLSREDRARLRDDWRTWFGTALLAIALIAPWFLYQYHRFGGDVWNVMFRTHVLTRFTGYLDPSHLHPWHYYFTEMFANLRASQAVTIAIVGLALMMASALGFAPFSWLRPSPASASAARSAPVLLSNQRYEEFSRVANAGNRNLLERVVRKSGMSVPALAAAASQSPPAVVRVAAQVLLLPGPYAECAVEPQVRDAGR